VTHAPYAVIRNKWQPRASHAQARDRSYLCHIDRDRAEVGEIAISAQSGEDASERAGPQRTEEVTVIVGQQCRQSHIDCLRSEILCYYRRCSRKGLCASVSAKFAKNSIGILTAQPWHMPILDLNLHFMILRWLTLRLPHLFFNLWSAQQSTPHASI
jgi:hypothetical protein